MTKRYRVVIAASIAAAVLFGGCEQREDKPATAHEATAPAVENERAEPAAKAVEEESVQVRAEADREDGAERAAQPQTGVEQRVSEAVETVEKKSAEIAESLHEKAEAAAEAVTKALPEASSPGTDAAALYKSKCAGCHGARGEKHALGKSDLLAGQTKALLVEKIRGYKDGTFGGAMKSIMKSQVTSLSDEQIDALAGYIATLK